MRLAVAVLGAGVGGLATAAGLAADGHEVTLFERFESPLPLGSGLVIQPVGQAVLDRLGAGRPARERGRAIWRMHGIEARTGRDVLRVAYGPEGGPRFGLAIQRPALFDALLAAAEGAGVTFRPSSEAVSAGSGTVTLADESQQSGFDLIVDATGVNSRISTLEARPLPFGALWATVRWPDGAAPPRDQLSQRYRRADRMIGVMPSGTRNGIGPEAATIFWSIPASGHDDWRRRGLGPWRDEIAALWPEAMPFFDQIDDPDRMTFARYGHGTLRQRPPPGVVVIGDAAHRTSPQLGQGANMALLDAESLRRALARWPVPEALRRHGRARWFHVALYQAMSRAFTPQYQSESRVLPVLRDRVFYPLSRVPPIPALLTRLVCGDIVPPMAGLAAPEAVETPATAP